MNKIKPLLDFLNSDRDPREHRRALAVSLALSGHTHRQIQKILGVSSAFVSKWKHIYEDRGIQALQLGYKGHIGYLTEDQKQEVVDWIDERDTWSINGLRIYLFERYGVAFKSRQSYYALLKLAGQKLEEGELEKMDETLEPL